MKKMSIDTKLKLVYSGELVVIALVALVIGILKLVGVIETKPVRLLVYNIITLVGAVWFAIDFIWTLKSEKRRKSSSILDKVTVLPVSAYLLFFDIFCFIHKAQGIDVNDLLVKLSVGIVLIYVGCVYIFLAIYHYIHPLPAIIEAIEETKQAQLEAELEEKLEQEKALSNEVEEVKSEEAEDKPNGNVG